MAELMVQIRLSLQLDGAEFASTISMLQHTTGSKNAQSLMLQKKSQMRKMTLHIPLSL